MVGLALAFIARERIRGDGPFAWPAFALVLSFVGIVVLPATAYLYLAHSAWAWLYIVDPKSVPLLALVPLVVLHCLALLGGWYGGARLIRAAKQPILIGALAGGALLVFFGGWLSWRRLGQYGSYDDFHADRALDLMDVKLGYVLVALLLGVGAALGYVALELRRDSRRVRAR